MAFASHILSILGITLFNTLGINLVFGKAKILHFGPIGVSLIGTYGAFLTLEASHSYALALGAGLAVALALSVLLWWLSLRLEPDGFGVLSIAVHLIVLSVVLNWNGVTHGALGIANVPRMAWLSSPEVFAIVCAACAALWVGFFYVLQKSPYGRRLQALAEQESSAAAIGVDRARAHLIAFLIAGSGALIANMFYVQYVHLAHPNDYRFESLIFYVTLVVAGKPGSVPGVTLSTVLLVLLRESLRFVPLSATLLGPLRLILFGVILLAAVYVRRNTLFPPQRSV